MPKPVTPPLPLRSPPPSQPMAMDPTIWARLPEELLDKILSFLPLKTLYHLRPTCKRFKSLFSTPSFLSSFASPSQPLSAFLLLSHPSFLRHFPLYSSLSSNWRRLPVSPSFSLLSSSNGLLCFFVGSSSSFVVCNVLCNWSKTIKAPIFPFSFELPTLVSSPSGFKLFVICSNSVFLYDSNAQIWTEFNGFDPILNKNHHQHGVHRHGYLYFTTSDPSSIVSFNLKFGNWETPIMNLPSELQFLRLISNGDDENGRLYMIGGVGRNGISRCLKLWVLENEENWVELETLPDMMYRKFVCVCYHNYEHVYCLWHQGMICICCYTWPEVLYYKVARRTWHWLPKCPSLPDKWSCGFKWFSFVPQLFASF